MEQLHPSSMWIKNKAMVFQPTEWLISAVITISWTVQNMMLRILLLQQMIRFCSEISMVM